MATTEANEVMLVLEKDEYTETEASVLLANYKQKRDTINKLRSQRGFPALPKDPKNIAELLSRTVCWNCGMCSST